MAKSQDNIDFVLTDSEVELFSRITNEYRVPNSAVNVDLESFRQKDNHIFSRQTEAVLTKTRLQSFSPFTMHMETRGFLKRSTFDNVLKNTVSLIVPLTACKRKV